MEFTRKKKKGEKQKVRRFWFSPEGYRIVWRCEVHGVQVPARYQACVRTIIPNYSGIEGQSFEMWDFTDPKHRLFKVLGKAQESCERHQRLWEKACEATGVRGLIDIFGGKLPTGIPLCARKKLPRKLYEILSRPRSVKYRDEEEECEPGPDDPTKTSDCSVGPTEPTPADDTPALPAKEEDSLPTPSTTTMKPSALPAEEPAKAPKKRATKRTTRQSPSTKNRKPTTRSSAAAKKPAKNSPKKKSKRSKN
ncbi:MAG: hypothetical protein ACYC35_00935 [Pirellulales bacterium]